MSDFQSCLYKNTTALGGLNKRNQFLAFLEIQGQGVGRVGLSRGLSPWLADGTRLLCPYVVLPVEALMSMPQLPLPLRVPAGLI